MVHGYDQAMPWEQQVVYVKDSIHGGFGPPLHQGQQQVVYIKDSIHGGSSMSSTASGYFNFRRCILVDLMHGILVVWYHPYVKHRKWLLQLQALHLDPHRPRSVGPLRSASAREIQTTAARSRPELLPRTRAPIRQPRRLQIQHPPQDCPHRPPLLLPCSQS